MKRWLVAVLVVLSLPVTACGDREPAPSAPLSRAEEAPPPAERCGRDGPAEKVVLTTDDGQKLAAARFGSGTRALVLVHQRGNDLCGWWTRARMWSDAGYHVLAIDLRCNGYSDCGATMDYVADVTAAVTALRDADAAVHVVLVGASMGASIALTAAGHLGHQITGVVSLSAHSASFEATGAGKAPRTPTEAAAAIRAPLLIAYAEHDSSIMPPAEAKSIVDTAPAPAKELVGLPGTAHGWDLIPAIEDKLSPFLTKNLP